MTSNSSRKPTDMHSGADTTIVHDRPAAQASATDLAEFEKFFREQFATPGGTAGTASKPAVDDPLMAELARIVGQDVRPAPAPPSMPQATDPFAPAQATAHPDPLKAFEEELRRFDAEREAARLAQSPPVTEPDLRGIAPEAPAVPDARRADLEQILHGAEPPANLGPDAPMPGDSLAVAPDMLEDTIEESRPRSRKVMLLLSVAGIVALVGVVGTLGFGNRTKPTGGQAPVIAAKPGPTKEKPADPGGVEIPGQDRQVLAKRSEEPRAPAAVVNKEEQPVDLNQTPKREAARVILPPTSGVPTSPILMPSGTQPAPAPSPVPQSIPQVTSVPAVEPKKVRSVRVNGEGEIAQPAPQTAARAAAPAPEPTSQPTAAAPKNESRPATAARTTTAATSATTPQPARPSAPRAPAAQSGEEGDQPLSLRPPSGNRAAPPARTAATGTGSSGSGGFAVQLKASPSEADARAAAADMKRRHASALGSYSPGVRSGTVGGKTVYRVRVSGLSREDANSLCGKIKADGGSCFVASN